MSKKMLVVRPMKGAGIFLTGAIFFSTMTLGTSEAIAASDSSRQGKVQEGVEDGRRAQELEQGHKFVEASDIIGKSVTDSKKIRLEK